MRIERIVAAACLVLATGLCQDRQDWTHYVRIGGHGLGSGNADEILRSATASHVFGIEVDNDITGRYERFLDPAAKLEAIREVAQKAHEAGNCAFVYIAGTECITANAAGQPHTMAKDHPDFRPAVEIDASPFAATQIASVDGSTSVFIANFKGLKANEIAQQLPETNVRVVFHTGRNSPVYLLPFLGQRQKLECVSTKASLA